MTYQLCDAETEKIIKTLHSLSQIITLSIRSSKPTFIVTGLSRSIVEKNYTKIVYWGSETPRPEIVAVELYYKDQEGLLYTIEVGPAPARRIRKRYQEPADPITDTNLTRKLSPG